MAKDRKNVNTCGSVWGEYENGLNFQKQMEFNTKFPEFERFKQGDQWPRATERTKSLPRPVFNIVEMFVSNKKSNVLNQNIKMVFSSAETGVNSELDTAEQTLINEGAQMYTDYAYNLWNELDQDTLNDMCVEDAATNGTGFLHYYWDTSVSGGEIAPYIGALRGETIDSLNIFVSNPQETDIQKQQWVIISNRVELKKAREIAKNAGIPKRKMALITPDEDTEAEGYDTALMEQNDSKKITILTKYYRKEDGLVYFVKVVKGCVIQGETCLTPERYDASVIEEAEPVQAETPDIDGEYSVEEVNEIPQPNFRGITRYPIAVFNWQRRKKCLWGYGEVEGIIPNQKAINFNVGMMLLSVQDNSWPKLIVKPGALRQSVTNMPGEILTDHYTSGDGVKYMQPPNFNYMAISLVDKVLDLSRSTSGVTEVATGEQLGANMAASAIIALQNQAKVPIDNIQRRFYRTIKEVGRIWEEFFKTYYSLPRLITVDEVDGTQKARAFTGTDYTNVEFKLKIDVGASSTYSESLGMATLDKMYDKGDITVDDYIELAPDNVMPFKETLKKRRAMEQQLAQQMQMEQQMQMGQGMPPIPQQMPPVQAGGGMNFAM